MGDDRASNKFSLDFRVLSSYLNRWAAVIVFTLIAALAVGSVYITSDDPAHVPVVIGVSALDSARSAGALGAFSELCREKGSGDISWRYLPANASLEGCDFYLTTALRLSAPLAGRALGCALIAAEREAHRYSRSAVIVRPGARSLPATGARLIFTSPGSSAGFLAPCRSLESAGYALGSARIDFTGERPREERVIFGVLYGAYDAGGISLERFLALQRAGVIRRGELDVLYEGESLPEIVLAYEPSGYTEDRRSFARRLPGLVEHAPHSLKAELAALGICGFYTARDRDIQLISKLSSMVPPDAACAGGAGVPARP